MSIKKNLAMLLAVGIMTTGTISSAFAAEAIVHNDESTIVYTVTGKAIDLTDLEQVEENELFDYNTELIRQTLVWVRTKYPDALRYDFYRDDDNTPYCQVWLKGGGSVIEECIQVKDDSCYVAQ